MTQELMTMIAVVPAGRVVGMDVLAQRLAVLPTVVATLISGLTEEERDRVPWHRVVAKGGAIGRGPHRDTHFARLVREGVPVSPAGIVQDMERVAVTELVASSRSERTDAAPAPPPLSRSRGVKDRP
ncbi:MAG: MGMT family protein [Hyphomicrobium sp.]|nr:MGMT family protein [Hyphomicrobium sp.]